MIREGVMIGLLVAGPALILIASIGVLRMPDIYMRMQTATKASSVGAGTTLLAAAVHFQSLDAFGRVLAITAFIFFTTPLAAYLVARAAHRTGRPKWDRTRIDRLEEDQGQEPTSGPVGER